MHILAIDFGLKRLGFAVGNKITRTASPLEQFYHKKPGDELQYIRELISEYEINRIIVGYPLNIDGTRSSLTKEVEIFIAYLQNSFSGLAIELQDERLSSFEAEKMLEEIMPDFRKRKNYLDSFSALVILRRYLDLP